MKLLLFLSVVFFTVRSQAQHRIKGSVRDANGKAPVAADIHVSMAGSQKAASWRCSKDGAFDAPLSGPGVYLLKVSAANHQELSVPLIVRQTDKEVSVSVQLLPNEYEKNIQKVRIIGDWNEFKFSGTDEMDPSGSVFTYTRIATADTLSYQLLDIAGGHSVNGTHNDHLVYDGGGDYRSVLRTKKGQPVTITFDPSQLQYTSNATQPAVNFSNNNFLNSIYTIHTTAALMQKQASVTSPGGGVKMSSEKYQEIISYLRKEFERDASSEVSQFAAVTLARQFNPMVPFDSMLALKILEAVPANSMLWALAPFEALAICHVAGQEIGAPYTQALAATNPSKMVRAVVHAQQLGDAHTAKHTEEIRRLYTLIKTDYGDIPEVKYALKKYNPDAVVQVGKMVPAFELELLGTQTKVSNSSLQGKYYLIDFWATWCGPCVREMPAIHKAYERFKGRKGFDILSVSMDGSVNQIAPFRTKWAMPWMNAFIPGVFDAEMASRFEVAGIPKPILVGPDGMIVAMESELRGEDLEATLEKFLGGAN